MQKKYERVINRNLTLVFEMNDIFLKLVEPDEFSFQGKC